jgi:branched-chain amino acid transport system ATP-binding protein
MFPRLAERRGQLAGTMSGGEQQMLALGRALMTQPRMIMLDEPSLGLAPKLVDQVFEHIGALKDQGLAILLVEQNAARALEVAHRGYVLELGRNKYEGTGRELLGDERVRKMYLGG